MHALRKFGSFLIIFCLAALPLHSQSDLMECYDYDDSAYLQSSHAAHWSAYVPLTALIIAGIWLSVADQKQRSCNSHCRAKSNNGLGRLSSAERSSSTSYSGKCCSAHY